MSRTVRIYLKSLVWIACLVPAALLVFRTVTNTLGPDPTSEIASVTGLTAAWLLVATLTISPVRALVHALGWLIQFRRLLGLFMFFYATLHMLTWLGLYANFDLNTIKTDLAQRRFVIVGAITYLLLLPLALTSTAWAIRKLGGKNWNRLHWLIYFAAYTSMTHYWWKVKPGVLSPVPYTLVIWTLLLIRPVLAWRKRRRKARAAVAAA